MHMLSLCSLCRSNWAIKTENPSAEAAIPVGAPLPGKDRIWSGAPMSVSTWRLQSSEEGGRVKVRSAK